MILREEDDGGRVMVMSDDERVRAACVHRCSKLKTNTATAAAAAAGGDGDDGDDDVCCSHVPRLPLNCCWNSMKTFVETTSTM